MGYTVLFHVSGPGGVGKTTLINHLLDDIGEDKIGFCVSHTTRMPRRGEVEGFHYHFVTAEEFLRLRQVGAFVEVAIFAGNRYGTSKMVISNVLKQEKLCLLDIDMQGVTSLKGTNFNPLYIFIKPPSLATLEERLRDRGTESEDDVRKQLVAARAEVIYADVLGSYDHIIVNDDLEAAYSQLKSIVEQVMRENLSA